MLNLLYDMIIMPLIQLTEFFYELFYEITGNIGCAVIGLSFVVTFLTLPLYMVAESWQETERKTQEKLKSGVQRIKETFSGDEQYMILNCFYRENHYHPIMALRSSFSLLIQVPFFIAAYNFLSNLEILKEYSFLFIKSFGDPDAFFTIGSFNVNILPIAMTVINCVAGAIYSKGHEAREKIQIYVCALVFLALLYNSPSGLVVYWTMNNVLSLVKNIFYKLKEPRKVLYRITLLLALALVALGLISHKKLIIKAFLVALGLALPFIPMVCKKLTSLLDKSFTVLDKNEKLRLSIFLISAISLAILSGLTIPTTIMESEAEQYFYVDGIKGPFVFLRTVFGQGFGFFLVWPLCFYFLFSSKTKKALTLLMSFMAIASTINSFLFGGHYGSLEPSLIFMTPQKFSVTPLGLMTNALAMLVALCLIAISLKYKEKILNNTLAILLVSLSALGLKNLTSIISTYNKSSEPVIKEEIESVYHLSKTGKNVIVFMQDRLFMPFVSQVLEERPELKESYSGFTYYPNCTSFATVTMLGTPGIFGGYSFTPYEMNKRSDLDMQTKHNQSILSMPLLFNEAGFETTVSDMPYENYLEQPVDSMYKDYAFINRIQNHGTYSPLWYKRHNMTRTPYLSSQIKRNLIWFSFFKMVNPVFRQVVYHNEYWLSWNNFDNLAKFIDNYSELEFLPELTDGNGNRNQFLLIDNEATHEPVFLQAPDFVPVDNVTDRGTSRFKDNDQYHTVIGTMLLYDKFFQYLKKEGLYDNTRIIIVSDHGKGIATGRVEDNGNMPWTRENVTATLLVKDFKAKGPLKEDMTFMTNADTPGLALEGIAPDAKNPFTNMPLKVNAQDKIALCKIASCPAESTRIRHNKKFNISDDSWYRVNGNIFNPDAWCHISEEEIKK